MSDINPFLSVGQSASNITAAAGVIGASKSDYLSRKFAEEENAKARDYNAMQAQYAREWSSGEREATQAFNEYMWNKSAEFNSESAKMKRMIDAGINPTAAAMGISGAGGSAIQPVTSSAGSSSSASSSPMNKNPDQFAGAAAAAANIQAQTAVLESQAKLNNANAEKAEGEKRILAIDEKQKPMLFDWQVKEARARVYQLMSDGELSQEQAFQIQELLPLIKGKNFQEIKNLAQEYDATVQSIKESKQRVEESKKRVAELQESIALMRQQINNLKDEDEIIKVRKNIADNENELKKQEAGLKRQEKYAKYLENAFEYRLQKRGMSSKLSNSLTGSIMNALSGFAPKGENPIRFLLNEVLLKDLDSFDNGSIVNP